MNALIRGAIVAVAATAICATALAGASPAQAAAAVPAQIAIAGQTSQIGGPITRSEVLARAQYWTTLPASEVGYSFDYSAQGPDPEGTMYRRDCSGYAAMALHLPDAPDSASYVSDPRFTKIPMADLKPGDLLIKPRSGSERDGHVMIFDHWQGDRPVVYEHSINHEPPQHRVITDARFADLHNYSAYRYVLIKDDPAPAPAAHIAGSQESNTITVKNAADPSQSQSITVANPVKTVVTTDRVYALDSAGTLLVNNGTTADPWQTVATHVTDVAASGNRVAVIDDGEVMVKDGAKDATWSDVTNPGTKALRVFVTDNRVGYLDTTGTLWVNESKVDSPFTHEADGVTDAALAGNRIAIITGSGSIEVKDDALNAPWQHVVDSGAAQVAATPTSLAYLGRDGSVKLQVGALNAPWNDVASGQLGAYLSGQTLVVRDAAGTARALDTSTGTWTDLGSSFTSLSVGS